MSGIVLKRLTGFACNADNTAPEVWVNPAQIAYVQPRITPRGPDGTRLYFQQEAGVLDVREPIGLVVASLQGGKHGICKDCYELLPESWMSLCSHCREHRHDGVDEDDEAVRADLAAAS